MNGAAGDLVSTQPPAASDPEAEVHIQSSEPLPLNSDPPSTSLEESTDVRGARHTSDLNSASADSQPDTADAESKPHHKLSRFGHWSHAKLQHLQSRLADKQWFTAPSLPQAPDTISSSLEQPAESEHLSLAHTDAAQRQAGESAQTADSAQTDGAESAQTDGAASGRIDEARQDPEQRQTQRAESLLPASIFPGAQFFLLGAASLLAAWSVSSLLLGRFIATSLSRPTTPEAQTLPEEGEEQQSPEAAYGDAEEGEPQTSAQGTSFVMRARSVVRSMSEAVSGLATNRSEGHEAEAGLGAESAPGGSGVGSRRGGRKPRGRRELAALGESASLLPLSLLKSPCIHSSIMFQLLLST